MRVIGQRLVWGLVLAGMCGVEAAGPAPRTPRVEIRTRNALFSVDAATLEIDGSAAGASLTPIGAPAFGVGEASVAFRTPSEWTLTAGDRRYTVVLATEGDALTMSIAADRPGQLRWPRTEGVVSAFALPIFGEGRYVPSGDPDWVSFLSKKATKLSAESLSLPLWTEMRPGASLTWMLDAPFDTDLVFAEVDGRLTVGLVHEFTPLDPGAAYRLRVAFGPEDPVAGARLYRERLRQLGRFRSLAEKAAANPNVALLGGAPHIYLWERGPLKSEDIVGWRRFVRRFGQRRRGPATLSARLWAAIPGSDRPEVEAAVAQAQGPGGFVSTYSRKVLTRALNRALPRAVPIEPSAPLPGGHDPFAQARWPALLRAALEAEYPGCLAPPALWGGGLSVGNVAALRKAGIRRAWLGAESCLDVLWHPEARAAAREAGYLLAAYDSYGSAHPTDLAGTWETAQMGDEIYSTAGYRDADGHLVVGFGGRGVYVNPLAIVDYARTRIRAVAEAAGLDSYFLDVDATGEDFADYTEGRRTSRRAVGGGPAWASGLRVGHPRTRHWL